MLNTFKQLSKSGITLLVLISVLSGYFIGQPSDRPLDWLRLLQTLIGIFFLASGASALNQYQERFLDAKMPRTANRPLPSGRISLPTARIFIAVMLSLGLIMLGLLDRTQLYLGLTSLFIYNGLYTLWWKKTWAHAAVPGAIPGALPIWMGYLAAHHRLFDPGGFYLFCLLLCWQMPHFWVLALRYQNDYALAGFPTLPVAQGSEKTLQAINLWYLAYVGIALLAPVFLSVGWLYLAPALAVSLKGFLLLRQFNQGPPHQQGLRFFLWINLSLIFYLVFAVLDLWSSHLPLPGITC